VRVIFFINFVIQVMKNHITLWGLFISASMLFSCVSVHDGNLTGNAALSANNYRYAGTVSATNTAVYILGIGGLEIGNQVDALRKQLTAQYPLRSGLAWANVSVTFSTSQYLIVAQRKATITLDIIDYWPDTITGYKGINGYYLKPEMFIPTSLPHQSKSYTNSYTDSKIKLRQLQMQIDNLKLLKVQLVDLKTGSIVLVNEADKQYVGIVETVDTHFSSVHLRCLNNTDEVVFKRVSYYNIKGLVIE
jgi:hypothetical protein